MIIFLKSLESWIVKNDFTITTLFTTIQSQLKFDKNRVKVFWMTRAVKNCSNVQKNIPVRYTMRKGFEGSG